MVALVAPLTRVPVPGARVDGFTLALVLQMLLDILVTKKNDIITDFSVLTCCSSVDRTFSSKVLKDRSDSMDIICPSVCTSGSPALILQFSNSRLFEHSLHLR